MKCDDAALAQRAEELRQFRASHNDERADLVVGRAGRSSTARERADLEVMDLGVPISVRWFGLSNARATQSIGPRA